MFLSCLSTGEKRWPRRVRPISAYPNLNCVYPHLVHFRYLAKACALVEKNMLWGTLSMPEILAFHDAKIASVGDGFRQCVFCDAEKTIHRTSDALVASFDSFPVAFATSGPNRRLPRLLHALPSVKKIGIRNPRRLPSIGAFSHDLRNAFARRRLVQTLFAPRQRVPRSGRAYFREPSDIQVGLDASLRTKSQVCILRSIRKTPCSSETPSPFFPGLGRFPGPAFARCRGEIDAS